VSLKEKLQSDDGPTWTDVPGWTAAAPKVFVASAVDAIDITDSSEPGFITYTAGNAAVPGRYSLLTPTTIASNAVNKFYLATVRAVYTDGTKSPPAAISTIVHDLRPVSGITLFRGKPVAAVPEGLLLSWVGHDNSAGSKL
jgi:hypothetical protein